MSLSENVPPQEPSPEGSDHGGAHRATGSPGIEWRGADRLIDSPGGLLSSSPDDDQADKDFLTGRDERKSAYYDYKQEKTLKQNDAKMFYQQQQQANSGWNSPVMRGSTGNWGGNLSRTGSVRSFTSAQQQMHLHQHGHHTHNQLLGLAGGGPTLSIAGSRALGPPTAPLGLPSLDKPKEHSGIQAPEMSPYDPHGVVAKQRGEAILPGIFQGEARPESQGGYVDSECYSFLFNCCPKFFRGVSKHGAIEITFFPSMRFS